MQEFAIIVLCVVGYLVIGAALAFIHLLHADLDPNKDAFEKAGGYFLFWLSTLIGIVAVYFAAWAVGLANRLRIPREGQASVSSTQKGVI
jgi:hypothetical protein